MPHGLPSKLGECFALVVREEMEWQGYNQVELARAARIAPSELSMLLNARHRVLMDTEERVADALGYRVEVLLACARERMGQGGGGARR